MTSTHQGCAAWGTKPHVAILPMTRAEPRRGLGQGLGHCLATITQQSLPARHCAAAIAQQSLPIYHWAAATTQQSLRVVITRWPLTAAVTCLVTRRPLLPATVQQPFVSVPSDPTEAAEPPMPQLRSCRRSWLWSLPS